MVIKQGEVWWAELPPPIGSEPGFRRPVVVIQGNPLNRSRLATVVVVPLTSNLKWSAAPGNVQLTPKQTGLPKHSVALSVQVVTIDKSILVERCGRLPVGKLNHILAGLDVVLDRQAFTHAP